MTGRAAEFFDTDTRARHGVLGGGGRGHGQ